MVRAFNQHQPNESQLPATPESHPWRRRWWGTRTYWVFQFTGWGTFLICEAISVLCLNNRESSKAELAMMLAIAGAGVLVSHLLRVVMLFHRQHRRSLWRVSLRVLPWLAAAALAMASTVFAVVLFGVPEAFERSDFGPGHGVPEYFSLGLMCFLLLLVWCGLYFGSVAYRHYQLGRIERLQLAAAAQEAELRALKSQINPHFLFNSLNSLRALIPRELDPPREAVSQLADFLRGSLTFGQRETVRLADELELVDDYLALEKLRHEARLAVEQQIEPAALGWAVPPFLLQTLVENALKYGIGTHERGGTIGIAASVRGDELYLAVTNPGRLGAPSRSTGLGVSNARARLQLLFGPAATLTLRQQSEDSVRAEVVVPGARLARSAALRSFA